jgi:hypothetical protein
MSESDAAKVDVGVEVEDTGADEISRTVEFAVGICGSNMDSGKDRPIL